MAADLEGGGIWAELVRQLILLLTALLRRQTEQTAEAPDETPSSQTNPQTTARLEGRDPPKNRTPGAEKAGMRWGKHRTLRSTQQPPPKRPPKISA
jgi:hypothetical protein